MGPQKHTPARVTAADFRAMQGAKKGRRARPKPPALRRVAGAERPRTQTFRLALPFLPPSVNKLFTTVRDTETGVIKRVLTANARRIRRLIFAMTNGSLDPDPLYELQIDIHLRARTRAGKVRKVDLTNRVKFLEDCVCEAVGIDDSHVFRVILHKHDSEDERTVVSLRPYQSAA